MEINGSLNSINSEVALTIFIIVTIVVGTISTIAFILATVLRWRDRCLILLYYFIPLAEVVSTYVESVGRPLVHYYVFPIIAIGLAVIYGLKFGEKKSIKILFLISFLIVTAITHVLCVLSINHAAL